MMLIPESVRHSIDLSLNEVKARYGIEIILAIESGSRAWGFPSVDSDYDVRIIYRHKPSWYLSLFKQKDTIELPINSELDIAGWEVAKSLKLMYSGNAVIHEWLNSPIVYSRHNSADSITHLASETFQPTRAFYHYFSMARKKLSYETRNTLSEKGFLYGFRTMLCSLWIQQFQSAPPMEFEKLQATFLKSEPTLSEQIGLLLNEKKSHKEKHAATISSEMWQYIDNQLSVLEQASNMNDPKLSQQSFNACFRGLINTTF